MNNSKRMKSIAAILCAAAISICFTGCGSSSSSPSVSTAVQETETVSAETAGAAELEDGVYDAEFTTDSEMFHVNETCDGKGKLTVENGKMTIHITLTSENIVNLYVGSAEDAQKDGAQLLKPVTDTVTYEDGTTEEVYGFDVPVPALDQEFDLALVGTKGKWYDHKVMVSNPVPVQEETEQGTGNQ